MWLSIASLFFRAKSKLSGSKGKLIGGAVALICAALLWFYVEHLRESNQELRNDLAAQTALKESFIAASKACARTNADNLRVLRSSEAANNRLRAIVRVTEEEANRMAAEAEARAKAAERALKELTEDLERLRNEDQSCVEIQDFDVGAACPAAVDRLREQASRSNSHNEG